MEVPYAHYNGIIVVLCCKEISVDHIADLEKKAEEWKKHENQPLEDLKSDFGFEMPEVTIYLLRAMAPTGSNLFTIDPSITKALCA